MRAYQCMHLLKQQSPMNVHMCIWSGCQSCWNATRVSTCFFNPLRMHTWTEVTFFFERITGLFCNANWGEPCVAANQVETTIPDFSELSKPLLKLLKKMGEHISPPISESTSHRWFKFLLMIRNVCEKPRFGTDIHGKSKLASCLYIKAPSTV